MRLRVIISIAATFSLVLPANAVANSTGREGPMLLPLIGAQVQQPPIVLPAMPSSPTEVYRKVQIGKAHFRVRVRGETAEVSRTNITYNANAENFAMMRTAVELVSGCKVMQIIAPTGFFANPVNFLLDCSPTH